MTASALAFPNSQTLAGWWRQLSARQPSALWVGHVRIHRIEALAEVLRNQSLDPLARYILTFFGLERSADAFRDSRTSSLREGHSVSLEDLESSLGLDPSLVRRVLAQLERDGLITPCQRSAEGSAAWSMTLPTARTLEQGSLTRTIRERQPFPFLEGWAAPRQLRFVNLSGPEWGAPAASLPPDPELPSFDLDVLKSCIRESPAWKQRHGFPEQVLRVVSLNDDAAPDAGSDRWQRVAVDRVERWCVLLSQEVGGLHGFAVRLQGWVLHAAQPCFSLDDGDWESLFAEAATDPPLAAWRQAWLNWGQSRQLPASELEACSLERKGVGLRALAGKRLMDRLLATRGDALKADNWLLAGQGCARACARLEIVAG